MFHGKLKLFLEGEVKQHRSENFQRHFLPFQGRIKREINFKRYRKKKKNGISWKQANDFGSGLEYRSNHVSDWLEMGTLK